MIAVTVLVACSRAPAEPPAPPTPPPEPLRTHALEPGAAEAPTSSGHRVDKRLHQEFPTPEHAVAFLDRQVAELLVALEPTLPLAEVGHVCTADGRHCTFVGPWFAEDLQRRWIAAVAGQLTSVDALEGSTIPVFRRVDGVGGAQFHLEIHAP